MRRHTVRRCAPLALAAFALCGQAAPPPAVRTVTIALPDSDAEIANPERGFYKPLATDLARVGQAEVDAAFAAGFRLLYARIDLAAYRDADLPPRLLADLDRAFAVARRGGVKLIVRATYNYPQGETGYRNAKDAPLPRVLGHLRQLKPVWARNADVIAYVQAGFVGAWGEWHSSSNRLTAPAARTRIRDALLDAVPADRFVQFRYPPYLIGWMPTPAARFRLGFHNDCLLASATDVGTYAEDPVRRAAEQAYVDRLGDVAPTGGETCNPADDPGARPRTGCDAILADGARYNLSYLNTSYYRPLFHDRWTTEGCMDDVKRRLGYRLSLRRLSYPPTLARGEALTVGIVMGNTGWARLANPRGLALLLRDQKTGSVRRLATTGADPRDWRPGTDTAATLRAGVPKDLPSGRYDLLFALPDADARLADDSRYAIRLANGDGQDAGRGWNAALGAYAPGAVVTIG